MGQGGEGGTLAVVIVYASVDGTRRRGRYIGRSYRVGKRVWVKEDRKVYWP